MQCINGVQTKRNRCSSPKRNISHFFVLVILISISGCATKNVETHLDGIRFYADTDRVIEELSSRNKLNPAEHFCLAQKYYEKSQYKAALPHYISSAFQNKRPDKLVLYPGPVLKYLKSMLYKHSSYYDLAVLRIAEIFFSMNELESIPHFIMLVSDDDPVVFYDSVRLSEQAYVKAGKYEEALRLLDVSIPLIANTDQVTILRIRRASIYEKMNVDSQAVSDYLAIIRDDPAIWQSKSAAERIRSISEDMSLKLSNLDRLLVSKAFLMNKEYTAFTDFFEPLTADHSAIPDEDFFVLESVYYVVKGQSPDQIIEKNREKPFLNDILSSVGDYYYDSGKKAIAARYYEQLVMKDNARQYEKQFQRLASYYYFSSRILSEKLVEDFSKIYSGSDESFRLRWLLARSYIIRSQWEQAYPHLVILQKNTKHQFYGNACFWLYKYYITKKDESNASAVAMDAANYAPGSWYTSCLIKIITAKSDPDELRTMFTSSVESGDIRRAIYANLLLYFMDNDMKSREDRIDLLREKKMHPFEDLLVYLESAQSSPYGLILNNYFDAGYEKGISSFFSVISERDDRLKYCLMTNCGDTYGHYYYAYLGMRKLFEEFSVSENISLIPSKYVKRLFPRAFEPAVNEVSEKYPDVDINLVFSIIKAESAFQNTAVSWVGATGLMQLMPATAKGIAKELKIESYDLKNSRTSILFGVHYLDWLRKNYDNKFNYMLGGYNAGPGNVNKWRTSISTEDEYFFNESIPVVETRNYIFSNLRNYFCYKAVYGEL